MNAFPPALGIYSVPSGYQETEFAQDDSQPEASLLVAEPCAAGCQLSCDPQSLWTPELVIYPSLPSPFKRMLH